MLYHEQSDDYQPLFLMQGRPIYANTLIIIGHITAFVVSAICISYWGPDVVRSTLALSTPEVWRGEVWRLFTYVAYDPYFFSQRSLWFLISILLLYFFGREVEQLVGRRSYLKFYAALIIVPAILFSLMGLFIVPQSYLNCGDVIFGVFVAFATIYPGAMPSFWVPISARYLMWILLGVSSLIDFAVHDYSSIFILWSCSAVAYVSMRLIGAGRGMNWFTDWIENRRSEKLARTHQIKIVQDKKATQSIDAILEKISRHGVESLDNRERAALEKASTKLRNRDQD